MFHILATAVNTHADYFVHFYDEGQCFLGVTKVAIIIRPTENGAMKENCNTN